MADEAGKIHVDGDWKSEAAAEKERLAEQERLEAERKAAGAGPGGPAGEPTFIELVNMLAMQAVIGLGGYQGPGGEHVPANPAAAKYQIDLLEVLSKKTEGNLTEEEKRVLGQVVYELRMQYVSQVTAPGPIPQPDGGTKPS